MPEKQPSKVLHRRAILEFLSLVRAVPVSVETGSLQQEKAQARTWAFSFRPFFVTEITEHGKMEPDAMYWV